MTALRGPLGRYRIMSYVVGVVLAVLSVSLVVVKVLDVDPAWYGPAWQVHGWLYMLYLVTALNLAYVSRWPVSRTLGVMLAGTVPFAVFFVEPRVVAAERARSAALVTAPTG